MRYLASACNKIVSCGQRQKPINEDRQTRLQSLSLSLGLVSLHICALILILGFSLITPSLAADSDNCPDLLNTQMKIIKGSGEIDFCKAYKGKVLLVVNTASRCGHTNQFRGLEQLNRKYEPKGFAVLGFPSNDFNQELSTDEDILHFCRLHYRVSFDMFEKSQVKGKGANKFYHRLRAKTGKQPSWNFAKYLIGRDGSAINYYSPDVEPDDPILVKAIEQALAADKH